MSEEKIFWELIHLIKEKQRMVPKNVLEETEKILETIWGVAICPAAGPDAIDYQSALSTLKKLLEKYQRELPKEIQEKIFPK